MIGKDIPYNTTITTSEMWIFSLRDDESNHSLVLYGNAKPKNKWRRWKHQNPRKHKYTKWSMNPKCKIKYQYTRYDM